jgi:undecaprenyl diphosphate synthase
VERFDIEPEQLPIHVAIIMDGNGRWAKSRNLPRVEGHVVGVDSVRDIVTVTRELNIPYLTLYAFSKENWGRPKEEVVRLFQLLALYLEKETPTMLEKGIRFRVIGDTKDFPKRLQERLREVEAVTAPNTDLLLSLALSYGGRQEILRAVRLLVEDVKQGRVKRIDEKIFGRYLYTAGTPDPDFLIRTSGELRISNFLLWQIAYTEIYVTETLWPDFRKEQYLEALQAFARRERRFGNVKDA